jgi:hypothetical protein
MVNVQTKAVMTPGQRQKARLQRVNSAKNIPGIRVEPASGAGFTAEQMRRLLKHPRAGGFRSEGPIEWPNDTFTQRRLKEGSVKLVEAKKTDKPDKPDKPNKPPPAKSTSDSNSAA